MGVPTFYTRLLARPGFGRETCRRVRLFVSGSAPLLAQTFEEFEARTGHRILERYGMTETGMNTSNPWTVRAARAPSARRWPVFLSVLFPTTVATCPPAKSGSYW